MNEPANENGQPQGAGLDDSQIKRLKVAIAIMTAMLVIGTVTLIARVIYLASSRGEQARTIAVPTLPSDIVAADARLNLPAGTVLRSASLHGNRLLAHYSGPQGDGLLILDLASGKLISHVKIVSGQ